MTGVPTVHVEGDDAFVTGAYPIEMYRRWVTRARRGGRVSEATRSRARPCLQSPRRSQGRTDGEGDATDQQLGPGRRRLAGPDAMALLATTAGAQDEASRS